MSDLVTLDVAKARLKIPIVVDDPADADRQLVLDAAEAAILDYIGTTETGRTLVESWLDDVEPPAFVIHAILVQFAELWRFTGDDPDRDRPARDPGQDFSPTVVSLLRRVRDPVIA